ncbi:MAG: N-acetyltransferase [Pseudomonadota bacterium]
MSLAIRPATDADDDAIWAILEPIFRAGETYAIGRDIPRAEALAYWRAPGNDVFVAEDGAVLGTYLLHPNQRGGGAHVCNCGFATAQAAGGRGVARGMLSHALESARAAGFRAMQFNFVVASNQRAVDLWQRHGFEIVGRLPGAFAHPRLGYVDAYVMYRHLDEVDTDVDGVAGNVRSETEEAVRRDGQ